MNKIEYKIYREENNKPLIDLKVRKEEGNYFVEEKVNNIKIENIKKEELNQKLKELEVKEEVKLEIKKAILQKQIGLFEQRVQKIEDRVEEKGVGQKIGDEFKKIEDELEKRFKELEERLDNIFK